MVLGFLLIYDFGMKIALYKKHKAVVMIATVLYLLFLERLIFYV